MRSRTVSVCVVVVAALFSYAVCEAAATAYSRLAPTGSLWLFEESGRTIHFDPVRGYRLTTTPSRWMRITNGVMEYVGVLKGNKQGFPSKNDFLAAEFSGETQRIAVFGDSFTAGEYLTTNWPDRLQDRMDGYQFLNFSVDGAGLANWWSIVTRHIANTDYQIDAAVFAVFPGNLERKFSVSEHRGYQYHMFGRCPSWDPSTYPESLREAEECLQEVRDSRIVSTLEFDRALQGDWPDIPPPPLRPVIASTVLRLARRSISVVPKNVPSEGFEPGQEKLMEDLGGFFAARHIPVMVVHIPSREELLGHPKDAFLRDSEQFSSKLMSAFVDGSHAFSELSAEEIRQSFFPYDSHWNQSGSDRFAAFLESEVRTRFRAPEPPANPGY